MKKFIMAILVAIISTSSVMGAVWSQDYVQHTGAASTVKVAYKICKVCNRITIV